MLVLRLVFVFVLAGVGSFFLPSDTEKPTLDALYGIQRCFVVGRRPYFA